MTPGGPLSRYIRRTMTHFNSGALVRAADAWADLVKRGDGMFVALAGAFSTGDGGRTLAELIRKDKVHGISCTGANLEEGISLLIARDEYQAIPNYRDITPNVDTALAKKSLPRVTDVAIPEKTAMKPMIEALTVEWQKADAADTAKHPHEFFWDMLKAGSLKSRYQDDPKDCWMLAAMEKNIPIVCPGYEDSTTGNAFASACLRGEIKNPTTMRSGIEAMLYLCGWYGHFTKRRKLGFLSLGGGIAADFSICCVPLLQLELDRKDLPLWDYFCTITDAVESYGGYSGAGGKEKISWGKLQDNDRSGFVINSDYTIVFPLMAALVLGL